MPINLLVRIYTSVSKFFSKVLLPSWNMVNRLPLKDVIYKPPLFGTMN